MVMGEVDRMVAYSVSSFNHSHEDRDAKFHSPAQPAADSTHTKLPDMLNARKRKIGINMYI